MKLKNTGVLTGHNMFLLRPMQITDLASITLNPEVENAYLDCEAMSIVADSYGIILGYIVFVHGKHRNEILEINTKHNYDPVYASLFKAAQNKRTYFSVLESDFNKHVLLKKHGFRCVNTKQYYGKNYYVFLREDKYIP